MNIEREESQIKVQTAAERERNISEARCKERSHLLTEVGRESEASERLHRV